MAVLCLSFYTQNIGPKSVYLSMDRSVVPITLSWSLWDLIFESWNLIFSSSQIPQV
jgi:hypothetical protein